MSLGENRAAPLRLLFFGLPAGVSALVLRGLLEDGHDVAGMVVPAAAVPHLLLDPAPPITRLAPPLTPTVLPLLGDDTPTGALDVAWAGGLLVLAARDLAHADAVAALAGFGADVGCVACFTQRIPAAVLRLPRLGFLNLHPSLLPNYRGPTPLFWQLRDGAPAGVTVHYLDEGLDTGDIAAQTAVPLPDGIAGPEADRLLTEAGLDLLRLVLGQLAEGDVRRQPQGQGSYYSFPQEADFTLLTDWPARRAFNFMRGTADWGRPYAVEVAGHTVYLALADAYNDLELDRPSVRHGRNILIRFKPGILYARVAPNL